MKLWDNIKDSKEMKFFLVTIIIFFIIGVTIGVNSFLYNYKGSDVITKYLDSTFQQIVKEPINYSDILFKSIMYNLSLFFLIFLFGNTKMGSPLIILFIMFKGYIIGYSFTLFVKLYNIKGLSVSLAGILPHNLIFVPCYILLAAIASYNSYVKLRDKFQKQIKVQSSNMLTTGAIIISIPIAIGVLIEVFLTPMILKYVVTNLFI